MMVILIILCNIITFLIYGDHIFGVISDKIFNRQQSVTEYFDLDDATPMFVYEKNQMG